MAQLLPAHRETILIVENEALVRLELEAQLTQRGYRVLVARDADEAIDLLDDYPEIALLFTDHTMPGSMDGMRLAFHVRHRWPPVKIIVTSGMPAATMSLLPKGCVFLAKPYDAEAMVAALALHSCHGYSRPLRAGVRAAV